MAVHEVTGIISEVPAHLLDLVPALKKATDKQVKQAHDKLETEIYGAPLKDGVIPVDAPEPSVVSAIEGGTA
jgi:hypothetical protein